MPGFLRRLPVERRERGELLGIAADDRVVDRQAEVAGSHRRLRVSAGRDPDVELLVVGARQDERVVERRAEPAAPGDALVSVELEQQVELLLVQLVVVGEARAEQRERFDERPTASRELDPAAGQQVDGRELLEDPDRVLGRQHGDRARETDATGDGRRGGKNGRGGADRILRPMVFPDAEPVQPGLVCEADPFDRLGELPRR